MELLDTKSILAKLMATENIIVEQRSVSTAFFDVENRILTLPILDQDISAELYDLFTGHEVGHALYTPLEGLKKSRQDKMNHSVVNIVEDSRIERKIKYKYPGLKNSFVKGYNELLEKNFFEIQDKNINELNFIDRINLHCKGGAMMNISFDEKEKDLLNEVEKTETFEDVLRVSQKIIDYMKIQYQEEEKKKKSNKKILVGSDDISSEEENGSGDPMNEQEEIEAETDSLKQDVKNTSNDGDAGSDPETGLKESKEKSGSQNDNNSDPEIPEIVSQTDDAYRRNESKLFNNKSTISYANIPTFVEKDNIVDYKQFLDQLQKDDFYYGKQNFFKFKQNSNKVVSYLVKEFEMRKNADQLKRASTAKTGDLNMSKIYSYQFNDDIFKKITVLPGGKSHGLIMYVDWSGSMSRHIGNTIKQLLNLVMFCKKVNIPYEVYCFVEDSLTNVHIKPKFGDLDISGFALVNIFSSRMNAREFTDAANMVMEMTGIGSSSYARIPSWMGMSGTPLNNAIIAAMEMVPEFQKKNKLQVVNTVFLTDGESHLIDSVYRGHANRYGNLRYNYNEGKCDRICIRDPKTGHQEIYKNVRGVKHQTEALLKLLKSRTKSHVIGFFIANNSDFRSNISQYYPDISDLKFEKIKEEFRKNKCYVVNEVGFDDYYILKSNALDVDDDSEFIVKENATTKGLASAFSKYAGNKIMNRVVLNRFIGLIT